MTTLKLTGERTLPGVPAENYWFRRHEAAYRALTRYCLHADVLEAGCGEGYGGELLRTQADARVVALDYDAQTIDHVKRTYPALVPVRGNVTALPFSGRTFDTVVSLQVIEHLWDPKALVREGARVLRPVGSLLISTPNRNTFSPGSTEPDTEADTEQGPANPFHHHEFTADELIDLLDPSFEVLRVLGVQHGQRITEWEGEHGAIVAAQLAAEPDGWEPELREVVESVTCDDFELVPVDVETALDLVVVAVRR
ncbi:MAG: class I SAM-dependent methyltransferase [Streptomycetales bacterium]